MLSFRSCPWVFVLSVLVAALSPLGVWAADVLPQSELNPAPSFEPPKLPAPIEVPGKEYSDDVDKNALGTPDSGQVVHWQGDGTTIWNSFDYHVDGSSSSGGPSYQTDALANIRDKYFFDLDGTRPEVQNPEDLLWYHDTVSLVVSFQKKDGVNDGYQNNIYASRSAFRGGGAELWANWQTNINATPGALVDLDGLELFGPGETDDANMFSRPGDLDVGDGLGRVSVFRFHPDVLNERTETYGVSVPYLRTQTLLNVVIKDDGSKPDWANTYNAQNFDLDAMMIWDFADDDQFGAGDQILFSVRPIENLFDGGEIWLYKYGDSSAEFLTQGEYESGDPRIWNTANQVSMHFFGDNLHGENIDALEAVAPEPASITLLFLGGLTVAAVAFRRRCSR